VKFVIVMLLMFSTTVYSADTHFVQVGEFKLEYEIAGVGPEVVLLEAGAGGGMADWQPVFLSLSKQAKVIRYSRVGDGKSSQIKRHFTSMDYANFAAELLNQLAIQVPVIYMAHSYGGSIARDFAAAYPSKVKALLLLDPSSEHDVDILRAINLEQGNKEIAQIKLDDMAQGMSNNYLDFWSKRPLPDYPQIKDMPVTVIASVKKIAKPANLFFTDRGRAMWGELWQRWALAFPQGRAVLTDKSGHFVQFDEPELVATELGLLLEKLRANELSSSPGHRSQS
jgi:pimeloyl-ACP methyl ester carboxylesterase